MRSIHYALNIQNLVLYRGKHLGSVYNPRKRKVALRVF
jgi:hypothetical protein